MERCPLRPPRQPVARSPYPVRRCSKVSPSRRRRTPRGCDQGRIVGLGEVDEPGVVPEVRRQELGMAVQAQARESPAGRSCEPGSRSGRTSPGSSSLDGRERGGPGEELVAVGARQPLDALVGKGKVEQAAGPAVRVGDEDLLVARPGGPDLRRGLPPGSRRGGCGASRAGRSGRRWRARPGRSPPPARARARRSR